MPLPPFVCKRIEKEDLWALADQTREKYWPENTLPVDTEASVEFRLRLKIEPFCSLLSQIGMAAFLQRDLSGIVVDHDCYMKEQYLPRMHFFFAHEMGHYFLHRDLYHRVLFRSPKERNAFILTLPEEEYQAFEGRADAFAARLAQRPGEPVPPQD